MTQLDQQVTGPAAVLGGEGDSFPAPPAGPVWSGTAAGPSPAPVIGPTAARPVEKVAGPVAAALGPDPRILGPGQDRDQRASADCRECETASQPGPVHQPACGQQAGGTVQEQRLQLRRQSLD